MSWWPSHWHFMALIDRGVTGFLPSAGTEMKCTGVQSSTCIIAQGSLEPGHTYV